MVGVEVDALVRIRVPALLAAVCPQPRPEAIRICQPKQHDGDCSNDELEAEEAKGKVAWACHDLKGSETLRVHTSGG